MNKLLAISLVLVLTGCSMFAKKVEANTNIKAIKLDIKFCYLINM